MKTQHLYAFPEHWRPVAAVFAALGDETRQKILLLFEPDEELSIKDIAAQFSLGRTTIVHHLAALEKAGVLAARREGKRALYSLRPGVVLEALENLRLYIAEELLP
jgi:DNA-binding transcriptional ArsR family regulator